MDSGEPFVGSEALACGALSRHQLRTRYRAVFPNVYVSRDAQVSLELRISAAWLWSGRAATIVGAAASALHGAKWIPDDVPVELNHSNTRPPRGVLTRRDALLDGETQILDGRAVEARGQTTNNQATVASSAMAKAVQLNCATNPC